METYYILKASVDQDVADEFLGPYASIEERDEECMKLHKGTLGKTRVPFTYYRTNVVHHAELKEAA